MIRSTLLRFGAWLDWLLDSPKRVIAAILLNWVVCSWSYSLIEHKGPISGLWWGIVTGTTVGYGDFYPASTAGRGVAAFLMVSMTALVIVAGAHWVNAIIEDPNAWTHEEQEQVKNDAAEARRIAEETNALVRTTLARLSGQNVVDDTLRRHNERTPV